MPTATVRSTLGPSSFTVSAYLTQLGALGVFGGLLLEFNKDILRLWALDLGICPSRIDIFSWIMAVGYLKVLLTPWIGASRLPRMPNVGMRRLWMIALLFLAAGCLWILSVSRFLGITFCLTLLIFALARSLFDTFAITSQNEALDKPYWGLSEGFCITGYKVGMSLVPALALYLNGHKSVSWPYIYKGGACVAALGGIALCFPAFLPKVLRTLSPRRLLSRRPFPAKAQDLRGHVHTSWNRSALTSKNESEKSQNTLKTPHGASLWFGFLDRQRPRAATPYWTPWRSWFQEPRIGYIIALMVFYRWQDAMLQPQWDLFLRHHDFAKGALAMTKLTSFWAAIVGAFLGGWLVRRKGYGWALWLGWAVHGATALLVGLWAYVGLPHLAGLFFLERLTSALAMIILYSFQLMCLQPSHTLAQLALITTLNHVAFTLASGRSGWILATYGWSTLFALSLVFHGGVFWILKGALRVPLIVKNSATPKD